MPHLNKTVIPDSNQDLPNDGSKLFSQPTTIFLALVLVYISCVTIWFIQSRYCSSARRGPAFLSLLRQRIALWKGSLFRNNSNNNYNNLPHYRDLDERQYKSWSVLEVVSWSRSKLAVTQSNGNHNHHVASSYFIDNNASTRQYYHESEKQEDEMILQQAMDALIQQQIDGMSLDYITLEYLSRWMPFGTAVHLMSQYDALISTYSSQEGNKLGNNTNVLSGDDLPSWYSDNQLHQTGNNHHQDVEAQDDSISSDHVQQLMKDRFGLPLPSLRTDTKNASKLEMTNRTSSIRETQTQKQAATRSVNNSNNLDDILKAMPQHIRSVAERRPDLVAELLASRPQQQLIPIHEEDSVGETEEEADFDTESESLLRRRIR
ncbi:hypothetical protein ACHAWT_002887 [Skeletonema menzelii]